MSKVSSNTSADQVQSLVLRAAGVAVLGGLSLVAAVKFLKARSTPNGTNPSSRSDDAQRSPPEERELPDGAFIHPGILDYLLPLVHIGSASTMCALWVAACFNERHTCAAARLRPLLLAGLLTSGPAIGMLHHYHHSRRWGLKDVVQSKAGHTKLMLAQMLHVATAIPLVAVEVYGWRNNWDPNKTNGLIRGAAGVAALSMLTGKYMVVTRSHELGSHVVAKRHSATGHRCSHDHTAEALKQLWLSAGACRDPTHAIEFSSENCLDVTSIDSNHAWIRVKPGVGIWRRWLSGGPVEQKTQHAHCKSNGAPAGYGRGGVELQYWEPGTTASQQSHEFWEEVLLLQGDLRDTCLEETFEIGAYAWRPPRMLHGPYVTNGGALMLVITRPE